MARPFTREGIETRIAIRTAYEANPALSPADLRRQFGILQPMVESAMTKTAMEWQALLEGAPATKPRAETSKEEPPNEPATEPIAMPGLEHGIIKFTRKPAKMGSDFIFWIPRVYLKNGLVDPNAEYEVYLKKK